MMSGIDEREEFEEGTFDSRTPNKQSMHQSKNSSARASQVKKYNFQNHATPNTSGKRMQLDGV